MNFGWKHQSTLKECGGDIIAAGMPRYGSPNTELANDVDFVADQQHPPGALSCPSTAGSRPLPLRAARWMHKTLSIGTHGIQLQSSWNHDPPKGNNLTGVGKKVMQSACR